MGRKARSWRESVELLLSERLAPDKARALAEEFQVGDRTVLTQQETIVAAMLRKAQAGSKDAAVFLRDTMGQAPVKGTKKEEAPAGPDLSALSDRELRALAAGKKRGGR